MFRVWNRISIFLAISLTACVLLPKPPTPTPDHPVTPISQTPGPTPLPASGLTCNVHLPSNTPAQSAPAVRLLDPVSGQSTLLTLIPVGDNLWTGTTSAEAGAILRYRYV